MRKLPVGVGDGSFQPWFTWAMHWISAGSTAGQIIAQLVIVVNRYFPDECLDT
jgi:hypothetical protein